MKTMKVYFMFLGILAFLFTACSKEETQPGSETSKATLTFGAIVQDLANKSANKQSMDDIPACSDDAPAYVEIILMQGDTEIVGTMEDPFRIDLVADQLFTQDVPELELDPGNYSLTHFAVYNSTGDLIWIAPKNGGVLAEFLDKVLPYDISLGAGVKKYVDVSVLCFDDRDVNQYGYLFFELEATKLFEFCFFVNYCDEDGRHYPARYSVDVSIDGELVIMGEVNTTGTNSDGDWYAEPLCLQLPDLAEFDDDEEYLDYTITLLDWEGVYDADEMTLSGSLSREDVMENFDGDDNVDYEHLRFGCEDGDGELPDGIPAFGDATFSNPTNITNPYYGPSADAFYEYEVYEVEDGEIGEEAVETIWIERRTETKEVMGIMTVIQHDVVYVDGIIVEDTDDWLAQDNSGNLWYMGELSKNYDEMGNFIDDEGSWEAGVDGALPGYWLPADPIVDQFYYQEYYQGEAEDYAEVIAVGETVEVNGVTYENVLKTRDVNPFEPEVFEYKYYASGTGLIKEEAYEDGELVEIVVLTAIAME
ncbi:hypothetical protein [Salinimicrobium gaetbulicola]|uniref:DUF4382 domain-containing protein n=1 Tax=Salinimicrobium gaetbulicola TaxID=999702 RepID=A0ABW3IBI9_9FLAO